MSDQQQPPVIKLRWADIVTRQVLRLATAERSPQCAEKLGRSPRWRTNDHRLRAGRTDANCTAPGRLCISKRSRSSKTPWRWAMRVYLVTSPCVGLAVPDDFHARFGATAPPLSLHHLIIG